jgi:hypothetical protein
VPVVEFIQSGALLQTYTLPWTFADIWAAAVSMAGGEPLGPFVIAIGGAFIAFLLAGMLVRLIRGNT